MSDKLLCIHSIHMSPLLLFRKTVEYTIGQCMNRNVAIINKLFDLINFSVTFQECNVFVI